MLVVNTTIHLNFTVVISYQTFHLRSLTRLRQISGKLIEFKPISTRLAPHAMHRTELNTKGNVSQVLCLLVDLHWIRKVEFSSII